MFRRKQTTCSVLTDFLSVVQSALAPTDKGKSLKTTHKQVQMFQLITVVILFYFFKKEELIVDLLGLFSAAD